MIESLFKVFFQASNLAINAGQPAKCRAVVDYAKELADAHKDNEIRRSEVDLLLKYYVRGHAGCTFTTTSSPTWLVSK